MLSRESWEQLWAFEGRVVELFAAGRCTARWRGHARSQAFLGDDGSTVNRETQTHDGGQPTSTHETRRSRQRSVTAVLPAGLGSQAG